MPKISVIIPCYNCSQYICRCITSFERQTFTDFEIIVVDDGSTDSTLSILKKLAFKESRLKVFHQDNSGVSAARNRGINEALGEYIVFCDADDFVGPCYLSDFFETPILDNSIIFQLPSIYDERKQIIKYNENISELKEYSLNEAIINIKLLNNGYPFGKLFIRDIINKHEIQFRKEIAYKEDLIFLLDYLKFVSVIIFSQGKDYNYCIHTDSLSTKWKDPIKVIRINSIINRQLRALGVSNSCCKDFEQFCFAEVLYLIYHAPSRYKNRLKALSLLRNEYSERVYKVENRADILLKMLYKNRMLRSYNIMKQITTFILSKFYS